MTKERKMMQVKKHERIRDGVSDKNDKDEEDITFDDKNYVTSA